MCIGKAASVTARQDVERRAGRNPRAEIRAPKEIRNPRAELGTTAPRYSDFGFRRSFGLRILAYSRALRPTV
jgi:hypothetical protein